MKNHSARRRDNISMSELSTTIDNYPRLCSQKEDLFILKLLICLVNITFCLGGSDLFPERPVCISPACFCEVWAE